MKYFCFCTLESYVVISLIPTFSSCLLGFSICTAMPSLYSLHLVQTGKSFCPIPPRLHRLHLRKCLPMQRLFLLSEIIRTEELYFTRSLQRKFSIRLRIWRGCCKRIIESRLLFHIFTSVLYYGRRVFPLNTCWL